MSTRIQDGHSYEELLLADHVISLPSEEAFKHLERGTCACEKPISWRGTVPPAGTGVVLKLCCMAKELEQLLGLPPGTFYQVYEFPPSWVWNSAQESVTREKGPDGAEVEVRHVRGKPPKWIQERMKRKNIAWK